MRKTILALATFLSVISFSGSALAAGFGDAGCGLGSMVFGNEPGAVQVLASTTNGTFGSQTFGITTGTSNCNPSGLVKLEKEREVFAQKNYPSLVKEMAMGEGENLNTLASLYGCSQNDASHFGTMAQTNFSNIVKSDDTSSSEMLSALEGQISQDAQLAKSCTGFIG